VSGFVVGGVKRCLALAWRAVKWAVIGLVCLEVLSFAVITTSNWIIYGNLREGPKAVYDPYTLFQMAVSIWPTVNAVGKEEPRPELTRSIWFFGGSTMRASNGPMPETIPSLAAVALNAASKPYGIYCLNFGVNSFNSLLEVKYLQKQFIELPIRPNLVVFYDGANDANYFAVQKDRYAHEGKERVQGVIESYYKTGFGILKPLNAAYYASFTRELLEKLLYTTRPVDPDSPELAAFVADAVKRYDFVDHLCRSYGVPFVLFLQPVYWAETCQAREPSVVAQEKAAILGRKTFPYVRENFMTVYGALERALAGKPYCVNLRDALCGRTVPVYTADGVHNTVAGRQAIVAAMLPVLRARLSLNPPAATGGQP
jgi:hypothetical protein